MLVLPVTSQGAADPLNLRTGRRCLLLRRGVFCAVAVDQVFRLDDAGPHQAVGIELKPAFAERVDRDTLQHEAAEPLLGWRDDRRPAALAPGHAKVVPAGLARLPRPVDVDLAGRHRQSAVFRRIGGKLVERQRHVLHRLGAQHDRLAAAGHLFRTEGGELRPHQIVDECAAPLLLDQQIVGIRQRLDARIEPRLEIAERSGVARGLARDRQHDGEQVLRAVRQLPHDEADMRLALVALLVVLLEHARRGNQRIERAVGLRQPGVRERIVRRSIRAWVPCSICSIGRAIRRADQIASSRLSSVVVPPARPATRIVLRIGASNSGLSAASPITHPLTGEVTWALAIVPPSSDHHLIPALAGRAAPRRGNPSDAGRPTFCS